MKRSSGVLNQKPPTFPDFKDHFDSGCASAYVVTFLFFYAGCAEGISWSKGVKECLFKKEKRKKHIQRRLRCKGFHVQKSSHPAWNSWCLPWSRGNEPECVEQCDVFPPATCTARPWSKVTRPGQAVRVQPKRRAGGGRRNQACILRLLCA